MDSKLLTVKEAAEHVGVTPLTVYNWVSKKQLPAIRKGQMIFMDTKDVEQTAAQIKPRRPRLHMKQA